MRHIQDAHPDIVLQIMNDRALRLNLKYADRMRLDLAKTRFSQSTNILMIIDQDTGFDAIEPLCRVELETGTNGLVATATGKIPGLIIPVQWDAGRYLSFIKLTIQAPVKNRLALHWDHNGVYNDHYRLRAFLTPGLNEIILPLYDITMKEPLYLFLGKHPGTTVIQSIEVRGMER